MAMIEKHLRVYHGKILSATESALALVARNDPNEQENVVAYSGKEGMNEMRIDGYGGPEE